MCDSMAFYIDSQPPYGQVVYVAHPLYVWMSHTSTLHVDDADVAPVEPGESILLLDTPCMLWDVTVSRMELRLYTGCGHNGTDLVTAYIEINGHTVEITYQTGYVDTLENISGFLVSYLGISGVVLRAKIVLETALRDSNGLH